MRNFVGIWGMPDVICNTSPLQYLFQLGKLELLREQYKTVIVPPAVVSELAAGRLAGISLPDPATLSWCVVRGPTSSGVVPPLFRLGAGENEVLALASELPGSLAILDDRQARL